MPLAIIIDNSLSMYKEINDNGLKTSMKEIASSLCEKILDEVFSKDEYEFVSLISASSSAQLLTEFTRDCAKVKESLKLIKPGDCFNLESALSKISEMVIDSFGCFTFIQILVITNEVDNFSQEFSIKNFYSKLKENKEILKNFLDSIGLDYDEESFFKNSILNNDTLSSNYNFEFNRKLSSTILPFSFPNRLDFICLQNKNANSSEFGCFEFDDENFNFNFIKSNNQNSKINYLNEIIRLNSSDGKVFSIDNLNQMFISENFLPHFVNTLFDPFDFELKCGNLKSFINLIPTPINKICRHYGYLGKELSSSIEIVGFINIPEFVTPQTISRHALVPSQNVQSENKNSFFFLLYSSLKSENMAAIVKLSTNSYGAINCGTDGKTDPKKKSHLTLAIFTPDFISIEAMLSKLNPIETKISASPAKGQVQKPQYNKSYSKGCFVWYRAVNLQSDVQKIFRNAKKMNEKMPIFYKELNRVRKAAITFGIYELFQGLSKMFERELVNSSSSYNPDATAQLGHVIRCLNLPEYKDYKRDIQPWTSQQPHSKQGRK